jgi:ribosome recycling factor
MDNDIQNMARAKMDKVIEVIKDDLETIRVGGAKPSIVENVMVEAYGGQRMKLMELATITAPDPTQLIITPWDKSVLKFIEKGIIESGLNLMPNVSSDFVRIVIPPLNEERRRDFVKLLNQKLENGKIILRQARTDVKDSIDGMKDKPGVSEDDIKRDLEFLQKITDEFMAKIEEIGREKEKEIMKV